MTEAFLNQKNGDEWQKDLYQRLNIIICAYPYFLILNIAISINKAYLYNF